ncbi:MAG: hypothetical protein QOJ29_1064 [Thermoleophilaceae bacterium]|nr:hypothetical protein [Thermoleophilaceae bacterium]
MLGRTDGGLTNKAINQLLAEAKISDPTPPAPPGMYVVISKRDRLFEALTAQQRRDGCGNAVLAFVAKAMAPVRFHGALDAFEAMRAEVNVALAFAGYYINDAGKPTIRKQAETLSEARQRAMRLRGKLVDRGVHPRMLRYCVSEIDDDNYFHAVFEASKSLADQIRQLTGQTEDGITLIEAVFESGKRGHPLLVLNSIVTETERSRQKGLTSALRGVFFSLRNPAAHEPKIKSAMTEQDALDELSHMSYLHRRLDECHHVPAGAATTN